MKRLAAALAFVVCAPLQAQTGPARPSDELPERMQRERGNASGAKSDWEREQERREFTDGEVALPAPPAKDGLIEFFVSSASTFRFYIDAKSLSVGQDGVVRYTLVARSPSGAETVTHEGMRCSGQQALYRVYAFGNDGKWSRNPGTDWKTVEPKSVQRWHNALRGNFFCPARYPIQSAAEGLDALRRGGHPDVANTGSGGAR
jgi:CNP1-like family protein